MVALLLLPSPAVTLSANGDGAPKVAKTPVDTPPGGTGVKLLPFRRKRWTPTPEMDTRIHQGGEDEAWINVSRCKFSEASKAWQPKTAVASLMEAANKLFLVLLLLCQVYTAEDHNGLSNDDEMWRFYDKALAWELKKRRPDWVEHQQELQGLLWDWIDA